MKNKKRVLIASSLSCAILLLSAATTQANSAHKDSQDQNKKEHVDKSQQKDKRNVTNKDKNSPVPDDIGKNGKITKRTETVYDEKTNILQNLNSTLSMIQLMTRMYYLLKNKAQFIQI